MRLVLALILSAAAVYAAGEFSNRRAPGFSLPDIAGKQYDPADYRGKVLVIDLMQTNCEHCRALAVVLEQAVKKYGDRLAVLSIVTMPDNAQTVHNFEVHNHLTIPMLFDCGQAMASYLRITPQNPSVNFPHLFFVDAAGTIRNDIGYAAGTEAMFGQEKVFAEIEKLLGGGPKK